MNPQDKFKDALFAVKKGVSVEVDGDGWTKEMAVELFRVLEKQRPGVTVSIDNSPLSVEEFCKTLTPRTTGSIGFEGRHAAKRQAAK